MHILFTHVRIRDAKVLANNAIVQPDEISREELWVMFLDVYAEIYPKPAELTKSIVNFGMVARERHKASPHEQRRDLHNHVGASTSERHRWAPVVDALRARGIFCNASEHDSYGSVVEYMRTPTEKKPLGELDAAPFFSRGHPHGPGLDKIIQAGRRLAASLLTRRGYGCHDMRWWGAMRCGVGVWSSVNYRAGHVSGSFNFRGVSSFGVSQLPTAIRRSLSPDRCAFHRSNVGEFAREDALAPFVDPSTPTRAYNANRMVSRGRRTRAESGR